MKSLATKTILCIALLLVLVWIDVQAQVNLESGVIGIRLSSAGSIRFMTPTTASGGIRQIERVNIIAALSEKAVCDYNEDQDLTVPAFIVASPTVADVEGVASYDNNYSGLPPNLSFRAHLYLWKDQAYAIAKYTVINDSSVTHTVYLGMVAVPRITGNYGGETNDYDAATQTAYCYRSGESAFAGVTYLSGAAYSFKNVDWDVYSPEDPNADAATDSIRYHMTADTGFDGSIDAGGDGSIYSLNAGAFTIAAHDSVILSYGVCFGASLNDMLTAAGAMRAKYASIFVSVENNPHPALPGAFTLAPNFPNPFNPSTTVRYDLQQKTDIHLAVYNLQGQQVQTLAAGVQTAGSHQAVWNGRDESGRDMAAGVYICQLRADGRIQQTKMILVR